MLPSASPEAAAREAPFAGNVPWFGMDAFADEGKAAAEAEAVARAKVGAMAEVVSAMTYGVPEAALTVAALSQPVIVVGFCSTLLGLVAASLRRGRRTA